MCGRYVLSLTGQLEDLPFTEDSVQLELELPWESYNIAPGSQAPILDSKGCLKLALWGLIPHWSKSPPKRPLFNARSETAATKPSFRTAYAGNRCIVPACGFFEWEKVDKKTRLPYYIAPDLGGLLWLAGLSSVWKNPDGNKISTYCILTRSSQGTPVESLHDRCPVILTEEGIKAWMGDERDLEVPDDAPNDILNAPFRVDATVNSFRNDTPSNIVPVSP